MAHFISDVTHQKLDQRREEVTRTNIKGLQCVDDFAAYVRCVANVVHHSLAESNEALIWTGNQDGSISIRRGVLGEVVKHIERKKNVFVYCLVQCGGHMWAGLSDGYLRAFDIETFELVFETKMHAGGISCMLFVQGYIFTGGYDWQILQWDPTYLQLAPRGQFSGHQNAVRCMATDGNVLYSGGDDHAIRCWDLDLGQEKAAPWPIVGHGDGVRALTVIEVYLFSASQDGTVKVWNTQTVQLVRVLDHRDAAYYTLLHDESCGRIWAGNTDGTITVWNATSLDPIATMTDHTGSSVVRLHKLNRINATKIWSYAKNGSVKVWFSESDPTASDMDLLSLAETELNHKIETMRNNIIHNYGELEQRRNELDTLEFLESQRKSKMVQTMTRGVYGGIACYYFEKLMEWRLQCMKIRKMKHSAYTMYMSNESHLQKRYFAKLRNYIQVSKDAARKRELGESLLRSTENGLKLTYLTTLLEYSRNLHIRSQKKLIANAMGRSTNRGLLRVTYNRWIGYCTELHHFRKANVLLGKLQQEKDLNMIAHFWAILNTNAVARSEVNVYRNIIHSIQRSNSVTLTRIYFTKLSAFVNRRLDKRGILASEAFMATSDSTLRRCYYQKLKRFRDIQNSIPLETQLAELQRKSRELDLIIRQRSFMNADSIQRDLEFRNQFYESSIQRALGAEKLVEQEQRKLKQLGAEFRNCARPSYMFRSMNDDPFVSSVSLLKILLNCDYHFDYITQSQSKGVQDPHKLFDSGVRKIAAAYREVVAPSDLIDPATGEWVVTTETIDKLVHTKKLSTLGKEGLSDIVVASDILNHQITRHASSVNMTDMDTQKYRDEFLRNINAFVDLAMALQVYQKELLSRRAVRGVGSATFSPSQSSTSFRKSPSQQKLSSGVFRQSSSSIQPLSPKPSSRAGSSLRASPQRNVVTTPNPKMETTSTAHNGGPVSTTTVRTTSSVSKFLTPTRTTPGSPSPSRDLTTPTVSSSSKTLNRHITKTSSTVVSTRTVASLKSNRTVTQGRSPRMHSDLVHESSEKSPVASKKAPQLTAGTALESAITSYVSGNSTTTQAITTQASSSVTSSSSVSYHINRSSESNLQQSLDA